MIKKTFQFQSQTISYTKKVFVADADSEFFLHADNLADLLAGLVIVEEYFAGNAKQPAWLIETADRINIVPEGIATIPSGCVLEERSIYGILFRLDPGEHSDQTLWYVNFPRKIRAFTRLDRAISWINTTYAANALRADKEHLRQINVVEPGGALTGF